MNAQDSTTRGRSPWVLVPPPPLFVVAFVVGLQVARVAPLPLVPGMLHPAALALGVPLGAFGVLLMGAAVALFVGRRTTIVPHASARSPVCSGPFRISRNPMYVGLTAAYVGATLVMNVPWPLVFLAVPLWVLQAKVIPFEEQTMTRIFGDEYRAYPRRVGRWLARSPRAAREPDAAVPPRASPVARSEVVRAPR